MTPEQLAAPASEDSFDGITREDINVWAATRAGLPLSNAAAFAAALDAELNEWADPVNGTVADVLGAAYEQWTGHPLPEARPGPPSA